MSVRPAGIISRLKQIYNSRNYKCLLDKIVNGEFLPKSTIVEIINVC